MASYIRNNDKRITILTTTEVRNLSVVVDALSGHGDEEPFNTYVKGINYDANREGELEHLSRIISTNPHIDYLFLRVTIFNDDRVTEIFAKSLNKSKLKTVIFNSVEMSPSGRQILAKALANNKTIEHISFIGIEIGSETVAEILRLNTNLNSLRLHPSRIYNFKTIFRALGENLESYLKVLDISSDEINDEDAKVLASTLKINTTLEKLEFDGSKITEEGFKDLMAALSISTLKSLTMRKLEQFNLTMFDTLIGARVPKLERLYLFGRVDDVGEKFPREKYGQLLDSINMWPSIRDMVFSIPHYESAGDASRLYRILKRNIYNMEKRENSFFFGLLGQLSDDLP